MDSASGFPDRPAYNLKDLLVEIVLSKWFRADRGREMSRPGSLRGAWEMQGARRLLTPEELERKTAALTGFRVGSPNRASARIVSRGATARLTDDFRLLYGGIDSDGITERARDLTTVMAGVAEETRRLR